MWQAQVWLISLMRAAMVVDLPLPVVAGKQHQALVQVGKVAHCLGNTQLFKLGNAFGDEAQGGGRNPPLPVNIDPQPGGGVPGR